jgi:hypothetical protein
MALIHLYLDESGHSAEHPFVVVAGLIGMADQWEGFKDRWDAILAEHDVDEFHMTDFEARRGKFKSWSEDRKRTLLKALMDEIASRRVFLFGADVSMEWFRSFDWEAGFPGMQPPSDAYHLAMQDVIQGAIRVSNTGTQVPTTGNMLAVVMGEQREFRHMAGAYYRAVHHFDETGTLIPAATFTTPKEYPQLQAADIAAFELRWHITRPDLNRYPWLRLTERGADFVYLRGIDAARVFPERTYAPDSVWQLVLVERKAE